MYEMHVLVMKWFVMAIELGVTCIDMNFKWWVDEMKWCVMAMKWFVMGITWSVMVIKWCVMSIT